jgi:uncharacterized paraquat-inducible protein A
MQYIVPPPRKVLFRRYAIAGIVTSIPVVLSLLLAVQYGDDGEGFIVFLALFCASVIGMMFWSLVLIYQDPRYRNALIGAVISVVAWWLPWIASAIQAPFEESETPASPAGVFGTAMLVLLILLGVALMIALGYVGLMTSIVRQIRREIPRDSDGIDACPACRYLLKGLDELRCPECGWSYDADPKKI